MTSDEELDHRDPPPSAQDLTLAAAASSEVLARLDQALIAAVSADWRKMARVVGGAMIAMKSALPELSDSYYTYRLRRFVAAGVLEARGNVEIMRFCELRLAQRDL